MTEIRANWLPSPHCDDRPDTPISLLVIHNISLPPGEFAQPYIKQLFLGTLDCNEHPYFSQLRGLKVSAHAVIYRTGEIDQFVDYDKRAWHAGVSSFQGRSRCNDYAIGIELEGTDTAPYTDEQYQSLAALTRMLQQQYPLITLGRIVGHNDIAPGRKTDPGVAFDWGRFRGMVQTGL
ncbi:1,6-anhydro-N-acetylmuramyl-L-alanine amidase AmpD [Alteromonas sediminis]|uniref:1,6-anhydro-N-acetylmuramyl-L-alanine amidase AmpD n=1 Tax=Alteromonas sediminis TaxID=2259342 RepID=A0A3N5YE85_9ALTE|nr:1,6-anhydro-N-acetylmuramyl-L-alanine amidase AmpD [Alteromonas sediminis]RPJ67965.1 1,6-anhydro-N-acetylmuramyl-L-alanine amidase AmpD [Alteromonas sediminis]